MTTIFDTVYQLNKLHLNKEVCFDGIHRKSYEELFNDAERLAASMQYLGIEKGDRVGVSLPNWYEFYVVFLATMCIGATIIPYNIAYQTDEVHYILQNSQAKIVFTIADCAADYDSLQLQLPSLEHVISTRTLAENSLEKLINNAPIFTPVEMDADDIAIILYTSGTTGAPKGAMLTHQNVLYNAAEMKNALHADNDDVMFIPVPLFHVFGIVAGSLVALLAGARIVLIEKYKAKHALELIKQEKITIHHGVPTMFILELNHPDFSQYDFSSLKTGIVAAAPCPVEIIQQIRHKMHCNILVSYGLSETSPALTISNWDDDDIHRSETVGVAIPGTTIEIVDQHHQKVPHNTVGEIAAKGPGIMKGYFNDPHRTQEVLTEDGWFYTGDLGTMDEDGYLRIVGRKLEEKQKDLLDTLHTYLANNGNLKDTSEQLFIHRSTLQYRLEKIHQLLQVDLTDADTRFNLMLALKMHFLH